MTYQHRAHPGKSHVGLGYQVCPICGAEHDEVVLLDRRLLNSLPHKSMMGWQLCGEHKRLHENGYVALVGCSNPNPTMETAVRTGEVAHVARHAWSKLFNSPVPEIPMVFAEPQVLAFLKSVQPKDGDDGNPEETD